MKLILLSSESQEPNEILLLEQMFQAGLEIFHLRKPDWDVWRTASFLDQVRPKFHDRVVLHDHYELIHRYNLRGIHLNARNRNKWEQEKEFAQQRSISCHQLEEVAGLQKEDFAYAFLSPIFPSISKQGYDPNYSIKEIQTAVQASEVPVIALGGISVEKIEQCEALGFSGAAVLGTVWNANNPLEQFQSVLKTCQKSAVTY